MKKIAMILMVLAIIVGFVLSALAADKDKEVAYYEVGDKGYFQYSWIEKTDFVIWPDKTLSGASGFSATITPETRVAVANREISKKNLDLLSGKPVLAYARIKKVGRGEGSREYCLSLTIFVLSDQNYQMPIDKIKGLNGQSVGASSAVKGLAGLAVEK